ncbi:AraC family transcriptional regulator [Oricola sp.]|uniref:AraC family transcriptional regulator n=1 Tax=Oricola sp. TaxID=1979950 RepID=UPI0025EF8848|nr:AraC family transcriptional regulator [Oricola sp.]MCI5076064.1 AraC family transcriptional regulator [Oricola sp.]
MQFRRETIDGSVHPAGSPLAGHPLFASNDLDEAREKVARVFCPHKLDVVGKGNLRAEHNRVPGENLSLNYLEYGAKTLISPGELQSFYLVQIPLNGHAAIACGPDRYYSSARAAAVLNPQHPVSMIWEAGTRQVLVQIRREALNAHLEQLLDMHANRPLAFEGALDISSGPGRSFRNLVLHLVSEIDTGDSAFGAPGLMNRQIEHTLMTGLIEAHRNNYSHFLGRRPGSPAPRHLRLAESFIAANLDLPLTIEDIANAAGTTPRTLQLAFRQFRGTTPLAFWRDRRLACAHKALMTGQPGTSVTDVATQWGFTHLGRFSQTYKARYGRSPSDTLRAALGTDWSD